MELEKIWLALVEIKGSKKSKLIKNKKGAYVKVTYKANSRENLIEKIFSTFNNEFYKVINIEDIIELVNNIRVIHSFEEDELINDVLNDGYEYSWGLFHTWDKD